MQEQSAGTENHDETSVKKQNKKNILINVVGFSFVIFFSTKYNNNIVLLYVHATQN